MTTLLMSPRLPGVSILATEATGPQYARWRREVKNAFTAKGTWPHCDGTRPMPMPESGPNFFSPVTAANPQPELLEERRAWVKNDRDVKMDIFLSVADEIKLEVFEVGPPLPPSAMTAKEMMEALDERFQTFRFRDYHHVFCHFLNLHIDQYPSLEAFNAEFRATLEDLVDHGYPLDNIQACSAYFSKLRCTQNPWVAKKLQDWDTLATPPLLGELMRECPPWMVIRPLSKKQLPIISAPESYSEDIMAPLGLKEEDGHSSDSEKSLATTASSSPSATHSRTPSKESLKLAPSHSRNISTQSTLAPSSHSRTLSEKSLEITVGASVEDLRTLAAFPLPTQTIPKPPTTRARHMSSKADMSLGSLPAPFNRPLPPIPGATLRSSSKSPKPRAVKPGTTGPESPQFEQLPSEPLVTLTPPTEVPPQLPTLPVHPALRLSTTPTPPVDQYRLFPEARTPPRPSTSHSATAPAFDPQQPPIRPSSSRSTTTESFSTAPSLANRDDLARASVLSTTSSILTLPLQGVMVPEYRDTIINGGNSSVTYTPVGTSPTHTQSPPITQTPPIGLGLQLDGRDPRERKSGTHGRHGSGGSYLSASPPRSFMRRSISPGAEWRKEEAARRKRGWSLKNVIERRWEVKEII